MILKHSTGICSVALDVCVCGHSTRECGAWGTCTKKLASPLQPGLCYKALCGLSQLSCIFISFSNCTMKAT